MESAVDVAGGEPRDAADNATRWTVAVKVLRPIAVVIGLGVIGFLLWRIDWDLLATHLQTASIPLIVVSVGCWAANLVCAAWRYRLLSVGSAPDANISLSRFVEITAAGFLLNFASMVQGVGVGAKVGLLKARGVAVGRGLAGAGLEVLYDLGTTACITVVFVLTTGTAVFMQVGFGRPRTVAIIVSAAAVAVIIIAATLTLSRLQRHGGKDGDSEDHNTDSGAEKNRWAAVQETVRAGVTRTTVLKGGAASFMVWGTAAVSFYALASALHIAVTPWVALGALAVGFVTGLLSLAPGGLGVRDLTWAGVLAAAGVPFPLAASVAVLHRALAIMTTAILLAGLWAGRTLFAADTDASAPAP